MIARKYTGEVKTTEPDEIVAWKWFDLDNFLQMFFFQVQNGLEIILRVLDKIK